MPAPSFTKTYHQASYPAIDPTRPELSVADKSVVIVGGSAGIGRATAQAFARAGAKHVIITGRTRSTLDEAKKEIENEFPSTTVHPLVVNLTNRLAVDKALSMLRDETGPLDVLVHNAGYLPDMEPVASSDADDWWQGFEVNVKGAFNMVQAFLRSAVPKGAVIINVSSAVAHFPFLRGYSSYAASKVAALKLFDYVAAENDGLRVVSCHPGNVETEMGRKSAKSYKPVSYDGSKYTL